MSDDTPAFRRKLRTEYENSVAFKVKAKKLVSAVEAFLASLGGVSSLADCVEEILPGDAIASPTSGGAHDAVGLLTPLSAMTESFCAQVRAMVVDPINSYVEDELQAAQQQYTSFLEEEKRVEKTRAEYLSMKSDTGREFLATKEKSYSEELFKLELVRFDTATKLEEVETRTDGTNALFWQRYLHAFANCQAGFYEEAAAYMRESAFHGEGGRQLAEKISACVASKFHPPLPSTSARRACAHCSRISRANGASLPAPASAAAGSPTGGIHMNCVLLWHELCAAKRGSSTHSAKSAPRCGMSWPSHRPPSRRATRP